MKKIITMWLACLFTLPLPAQQTGDCADSLPSSTDLAAAPIAYRYRVYFTDKKGNGFSVKHPEKFLSSQSIARRERYALPVDEYDLPVTPRYLDALRRLGLKVCNWSKWNNTAVVEMTDTLLMAQVRKLPFVKADRLVWIAPEQPAESPMAKRQDLLSPRRDTLQSFYGHAATQVTMLGADQLHAKGYRGKGITIAVIDGGFCNADLIPGLAGAEVKGTRNYVHPNESVYDALSHGMMVLSCIAANEPYSMVGTAPEASFYLLQSEDGDTEQLVEEDNWCAAVEHADSLGCDIITSSLGYHLFDHKAMNHRYWELDGQTALNSRSASLAASRGILLLNSAGNAGRGAWKKIGCPADACDMLAVGAVDAERCNTFFSSVGHSADGRIKPDVMAMGEDCAVYDTDGAPTTANGTSFACPILCGAAACLMQEFPYARPTAIIRALQQSADNAAHPDNIFGYGIPWLPKAEAMLGSPTQRVF
ncbi:MAG: S8 family serine peptidase [Alloprevotella sp.]